MLSDEAEFRRDFRRMLLSVPGLRLAGEATDLGIALDLTSELEPDILLLHFRSWPSGGLRGVHGTDRALRGVRMIAVLDSVDREGVIAAFRAGAHGILRRQMSGPHLPECLRRVAASQPSYENEILSILLAALRDLLPDAPCARASGNYQLTRREMEIIAKISYGHSNREVSETFSISERTVKHYLTRIFEKVGVSNRVELALFAVSHEMRTLVFEAAESPVGTLSHDSVNGESSPRAHRRGRVKRIPAPAVTGTFAG